MVNGHQYSGQTNFSIPTSGSAVAAYVLVNCNDVSQTIPATISGNVTKSDGTLCRQGQINVPMLTNPSSIPSIPMVNNVPGC